MIYIKNIKFNNVMINHGVSVETPLISWEIVADNSADVQEYFEIQLYNHEKQIFSERIKSHLQMYNLPDILENETEYVLKVRLEDTKEVKSEWKIINFETLPSSEVFGNSKFITGDTAENKKDSDVKYYRRIFNMDKPIEKVTAYATAKGVFNLYFNGHKINEGMLLPGWTEYKKRILCQSYEITEFCKSGDNTIGAMVGEGWYKGNVSFGVFRNNYGESHALLVSVKILYQDGSEDYIESDDNWEWAPSPFLNAELFNGEVYDARNEVVDWCNGECEAQWNKVHSDVVDKSTLKFENNPVIGEFKEFFSKEIYHSKLGKKYLDFEQNMSGILCFSVQGKRGDVVRLKHFEVLDKDGEPYHDNLKEAKQEIVYILKGEEEEFFCPQFTYQGFRYVEIIEYPGVLEASKFTAKSITSIMDIAGDFVSSSPQLNQLYSNINWGLNSNFVSIPTDCPQRSERLGWAGDAQIFQKTALYMRNAYSFYTSWLKDVANAQYENGSIPHVVPDCITEDLKKIGRTIIAKADGASGWADCIVLMNLELYKEYGDISFLKQMMIPMKKWIDYMSVSGENRVSYEADFQFGDWVALDNGEEKFFGKTPTDYIANCYYYKCVELYVEACKFLGMPEVKEYEQLKVEILTHIQKNYIVDELLSISTQTAFVIGFQMGIFTEYQKSLNVKKLVEMLMENDCKLNTGFLGTPYLLHALSENGEVNMAYQLLFEEEFPSWLYQVNLGATTIWEHWDGVNKQGEMWDPDMNSFNHYSYGSVGRFLFEIIGGIKNKGIAYDRFEISPKPNKMLGFAKGKHLTNNGYIISEWHYIEEDMIQYDISVPFNTECDLTIENIASIDKTNVKVYSLEENNMVATLQGGDYMIRCKIYEIIRC